MQSRQEQLKNHLESLIVLGLRQITSYQKEIVDEALVKGSAGLALSMGHGKTFLSLLLSLLQLRDNVHGHILVVVAKSLIQTWKDEISKFFGDQLSYEVLHKDYVKKLEEWQPTATVVLVTPELLSKTFDQFQVIRYTTYIEIPNEFAPPVKYYRRLTKPCLSSKQGLSLLYATAWQTIIFDEVHQYFNVSSTRTLAMIGLHSKNRWLLSGTLLAEPRVEKIFAYYLILQEKTCPRNLPDFKNYISDEKFTGIKYTMVLRETNITFTPPAIKKEIISHPLSEEEAKIYSNTKVLLNLFQEEMKKYKGEHNTTQVKIFNSYITSIIGYLRQCLVCPLIPITSMAIDVCDLEERSELSEIFLTHVRELELDAWLNDTNSLYSSRIAAICDKTDSFPQEKIIIFSCFCYTLDVLLLYLEKKKRPLFIVKSAHSTKVREQIIAKFKDSPNGILLITYNLGGCGLNLQAASVVMFVDLWWNSSKSDQGAARIIRPGQLAAQVHLCYFTSNTGMEKALFNLQFEKLEKAKEIMSGNFKLDLPRIKTSDIIDLINTDDNVEILQRITC